MILISASFGSQFQQIDKKSILDSAEAAGFQFPYSCRGGRCSSCKCKVLSGETDILSEELGLTEDQKLQGWILSCVRIAATDLQLEVENLSNLPLIKPKTFPSKIDLVTKISGEVVRVFLRLPPGSKVEYYAGQYIEVILGSIRRSYSIANAPNNDNRLELHIRKVDQGTMSEYWFENARKNDLLRINGPFGTFYLRDVVGKDLVFLATGTGIAPIKAILELLSNKSENEQPESVTVFWGGRDLIDLYWNLLECQYPVSFVPVLSRPLKGWSGKVGYVQDVFIGMAPNLNKTVVYACGSDKMIRSASDLLINQGLAAEMFYSDAFVASGFIHN